MSAYGGAVHTRPASLRVDQPERGTTVAFERVSFSSESFDPPIYYGYRIARVMSRRHEVFVEGELIHAKLFAEGAGASGSVVLGGRSIETVPFSAVVRRFAISHGLNFVLANVGVRRPIEGRTTAILRAGAGPLLPHPEIEVNGVTEDGYQLAGLGLHAAAGVEVRLWRRVSLLGEYKLTHARLGLSIGRGTAALNTTSHHLAMGLSAALP